MNARPPVRMVLFSLGLGILVLACEEDQVPGTEGNTCYENGTCNEGLTCLSKVCVKRAVQDAGPGDAPAADTVKPDASVSLEDVEVSPAACAIARGTTQQLSATGIYSDSSKKDLTGSVIWSSSDSKVATVSVAGLATAVAPGSATITARSGKISGSSTITVTAATLVSIGVTPAKPSITKGSTQQLTATGIFTDSSKQDLSGSVTWSTSDSVVATVSAAGLATAAAPGSATITASSGSISGSTTLTVTAATLVSIEVTPAMSAVAKGSTQQFAATGIYSDSSKQDLTSSVTWSSSNTKVVTVSNASGSAGLATANSAGAVTVTGTLGSISGSTSLSVTPAKLSSITVTPAGGSVAKGVTVQFSATGVYTDNSKQDLTGAVIWSSSNSLAASIFSAGGAPGLAQAKDPGTTTITAAQGSISGSTTLVVTAASLKSVAVNPAKSSIARGTTRQFTAIGTYTDSSKQNLTSSAVWSSSDSKVAGISNAPGSEGRATGAGTGSATITAYSGTVSGTASLSVTSATLVSLAVTPPNPSVAKGLARQLTAMGSYSDSSTQDLTKIVTWSSSNKLAATISNAAGSEGRITTVQQGAATITAVAKGIKGSTMLTVTAAELASVAVAPFKPSVASGLTRQLAATGTYTDGLTKDLTKSVKWSSLNIKVATIPGTGGTEGLARGISRGQVTITASQGSICGSTTLTVLAPVGTGWGHSCWVKTDGTLWCWGHNFSQQLGDGTTTNRSSPVQAGKPHTWVSVSGGAAQTCGLRSDGTIVCWGASTGTVGPPKAWASVVVGEWFHTCGLMTDASLWCWGNNSTGQLGDGTTTSRTWPARVGLKNWASVAAGFAFTCGVRSDQTVWCWGYNDRGQLGDGTTTNRISPVQVGALKTWTEVSARGYHACGLRANGTLWCWGHNYNGQLGDGTNTNRSSPVQVGKLKTWVRVTAGYNHTCGLQTDGTLWCWGSNTGGHLGVGTKTNRSSPAQVGKLKTWLSVTPGHGYTCGVQGDGTLWCWGYNYFGNLGDGTTTTRTSPVQVKFP